MAPTQGEDQIAGPQTDVALYPVSL